MQRIYILSEVRVTANLAKFAKVSGGDLLIIKSGTLLSAELCATALPQFSEFNCKTHFVFNSRSSD